jgi:ABC-type transport system involved in multi-copper enzyme maturation permease subunit
MSARDPERYAHRLAPAGAVLAVAGGCAGGWLGFLIAGVGLLLLLTACVSRDDGLLLLGPFVRAELVRAGRTRRLALWRALYAAATAGMAALCFLPALRQPVIDPRAFPPLAETFFVAFAVVQFLYLTYLTAAVIAPIVAEEREARRWDFLLATDLRAREILLGKAVGRLPLLLDPVLASLPILALLPLFGGVSPRLVVLVGVATLAMMVGVSGLAFFHSAFAPTAKLATDRTLGFLFYYVAGSGILCAILANFPTVWGFPTSVGLSSPVKVADVVEVLNTGNPAAALWFASVNGRSSTFEDALEVGTRRFVAFQLGVFFLFGLVAITRLRRAVPWHPPGKVVAVEKAPVRSVGPRPGERPPVGELPVYWWQRYGGLTRQQLTLLAYLTPRRYGLLFVGCVVALVMVRALDTLLPYPPGWISEVFQGLIPGSLGMASWILMASPALRAAGSVARERSADTLDALRLTALTPGDVLYQKWLGCAVADWPMLATLGVCAAAAVVMRFLHPVALLGMLVELPVYIGASAAIGLFFSVRAANPSQAVRYLILSAVAVLGTLVLLASQLPDRLSMLALTVVLPPAGITITLLVSEASRGVSNERVVGEAAAIVMGMILYAAYGRLLWLAAVRRLEWERHSE